MKNKNLVKVLIAVMVLVLSIGTFSGCSEEAEAAEAGTIILKVNPEIAVNYDEEGNVLSLEAINDDAKEILEQCTDFKGKTSHEVIKAIIKLLSEAGYFETSVEGKGKKITFEIMAGSALPSDDFLDSIITEVKGYFKDKKIGGKITVKGASNYGISQYSVSDYGDSSYKEKKKKDTVAVPGSSNDSNYSSSGSSSSNNSNYSDYDNDSNYSSGGSSSNNSNYNNSNYNDNDSNYSSGGSSTNNSNYNDSNYNDNDSNYDNDSAYDNDSDYDD